MGMCVCMRLFGFIEMFIVTLPDNLSCNANGIIVTSLKPSPSFSSLASPIILGRRYS